MRPLLPTLAILFTVFSPSRCMSVAEKQASFNAGLSGEGSGLGGGDQAVFFETFQHVAFPDYSLRLKEPKLCDPSVRQRSGYLDIADGKHLFFWFFESRSNPSTDPLILWLSGGPGCSSSTGLLFELGPCSIATNTSTTHNPFSWNTNANVIFLDQPSGVGYSYSDPGSEPVYSTPTAAKDAYAFLQMFIGKFPDYSKLPFHLATESYGGHYLPHIGSLIHKKNKELVHAPSSALKKINLESLLIGNGLTDPLIQMPSVVDYVCDGPFAILNSSSPTCTDLRRRAPICERLIKECYEHDTEDACSPATVYCWEALFLPIYFTGYNIYDARQKCTDGGVGCYEQLSWIQDYLNQKHIRAELGAIPDHPFEFCNIPLNLDFKLRGDGMRNSRVLLTELVNEGIRVLIYAGNVDMMCNYQGVEKWVLQLDSVFRDSFVSAPLVPWHTPKSGRHAGVVRSVGAGAGNLTYITVFEAGHMVPFDQPEAAADMVTRWIQNLRIGDQ